MRLILIRHGETHANLTMRWSGAKDLDITDLTENGKKQAQESSKVSPGRRLKTNIRRKRTFSEILGTGPIFLRQSQN